ncbi:MAG: DUF5667 domain-containing protein [Chloroflexota bacterium]
MNDFEQALQDCLDQIQHGGKSMEEAMAAYPQYRQQLKPLLETAGWLENRQPALSMTDEQAERSRQRLLRKITQENTRRPARKRLPAFEWAAPRLRLNAVGALVLIVGILITALTAVTALAAQPSLPGEILYPVKITVEQAQIALTIDPIRKSRLHLDFANRRLLEAEELSRLRRYEQIPPVLDEYGRQVDQAMSILKAQAQSPSQQTSTLTKELQLRLAQNIQQLTALEHTLPPQASPAARQALGISSAAAKSLEQISDETQPAALATITPTPTHHKTVFHTLLPSASPTLLPPGQIKKTTIYSPTAPQPPLPTLKPTKTPKPVKTVKPANTHKPPTQPPPVKPTKKTKP